MGWQMGMRGRAFWELQFLFQFAGGGGGGGTRVITTFTERQRQTGTDKLELAQQITIGWHTSTVLAVVHRHMCSF